MTDIAQLSSEGRDLLMQLIATPRVSRSEASAADIVEAFLERRGLDVRREANNVWAVASAYDASRPTLLLCAHIDTVRPTAAWTRQPHEPLIEGDRLYGIGSNDDGASLVSLIQTFRVINARPRNFNLILACTAEEEVSGADGLTRLIPQLPHIDVALVGEPTRMQPAVAERGLMVLDCTAHGRAGHAARNEGINAITEAIKDIGWFSSYRFEKESQMLGPVKMTTTIIQAGTQHNVIPDTCTFTVDVRSNEFYSNQDIYNIVRACVKSDVVPRSFRLSSSRIDIDHPLVSRALALGPLPDGSPRTPFGSPTLSDQALMPWPSLKMGPGDSARSHTADEYICLSELQQAIGEYITMLDGLSL